MSFNIFKMLLLFLDITTRSSKSYEVIQDGKSRIFGGSSAITIPGSFITHPSLAQERVTFAWIKNVKPLEIRCGIFITESVETDGLLHQERRLSNNVFNGKW